MLRIFNPSKSAEPFFRFTGAVKALWVPANQFGGLISTIPVIERLLADGVDVTAIAPGALQAMSSSVSERLKLLSFDATARDTGREKVAAATNGLEFAETQDEKEARIFQRTQREVADIEAAIDQVDPDLILGDPFVMGTPLAGERNSIPVVSLIHHLFDESASHYWPHQHVWRMRDPRSPQGFTRWWNGLRGQFGLPPEPRAERDAVWWPHSSALTVLLTHPGLRYRPKSLPEYVKIVMPQAWEPLGMIEENATEDACRKLSEALSKRVLITNSSYWQKDLDFVETLMEACQELGWTVVSTIPAQHDSSSVRNAGQFLSHTRLLTKTDILVTGAGIGTALRAIESNTPLLACPFKRDTVHIAEVLSRAGVAEIVPYQEITFSAAKSILRKVADNQEAMTQNFLPFELTLARGLSEGSVLDVAALSVLIQQTARG